MTYNQGTSRLIIAIVSTIFQEAAIAMIVLLALPLADIKIPLPGLIAIMVVWGAIAFVVYRLGSKALTKKPLPLTEMFGSRGKVVITLNPHGVIRIKNELWDGVSEDRRKINAGEEILVVGQDSLRLTVRRINRVKK